MTGEVLEELIYELYTLNGYFCLRNIPAKTKKVGGRDEIDIVAVKFKNNTPDEVVWIEVTEFLSGGEEGLRDKFVKEKEEYIKNYLKEFYNISWSNPILDCYILACVENPPFTRGDQREYGEKEGDSTLLIHFLCENVPL